MTGGQVPKTSKPQASRQKVEEADPSTRSSPSVWIFGYGSLLWKTNFPYEEMVVGHVKGYVRRFWQGSTDHRGVPGAPGRVVTLVKTEDDECTWGIAYKVHPEDVPEVMAYLDHREKGGYTTHEVTFYPIHKTLATFSTLVYIGTETNPEFLGPAPLDAIARQVVSSRGPSGCNVEYVLELAISMKQIAPKVNDEHLFELESEVRKLMKGMQGSEGKVVFAAGQLDCNCSNCADKTIVNTSELSLESMQTN